MSFTAAFARADTYSSTNLQSDLPGVAAHVDPNLVNPWGMAANSTGSVIWVSDNGTGVSTLYDQAGASFPSPVPLVVTIPTAARNKDGGNPTGIVRNGTAFFQVTKNGVSAPARFIFVSEDGSISGWNPMVDGTHAIIAVDNGTNLGSERAIYKGATLGMANGHNFLYVTNFHTGRVETYDENFRKVNPRGFVDHTLPAGYAPFGVRRINNYNVADGTFIETISHADATPLEIDGLWDLLPLSAGVYFTAGIADEEHGLFGIITED